MSRIHQHHQWNDRTGETGDTLETEMLYAPNDPRLHILRYIDSSRLTYESQGEAIKNCLDPEHNPGIYHGDEFYDPPAGWMRDVHFSIVKELGIDDWSQVKVVPTLKTTADRFHGIDFLIIYTPERGKEIIVSVDISMRNKDEFKADVLVTETGAKANPDYFLMNEVNIPDRLQSSRDEVMVKDSQRRELIGILIGNVIREKRYEDQHYDGTLRYIRRSTHRNLSNILRDSGSKAAATA